MDVVLSIVFFIEGVLAFIGLMFCYFFFKNVRALTRAADTLDTTLKDVKLVYTEQVNDMIMMHDRITRSFVAQAQTEDELWDKAKSLYPNKELVLSDNPDLTTNKK